MKTPHFDKWVQGINARDPVALAAAVSIRSRLDAVRHFLPQAAQAETADSAAVHELRVHTRRTTAVLHLYQESVPRHRADWMFKNLKRIRKAANNARDLDVLIDRYSHDSPDTSPSLLLEFLKQQRRDAQGPLQAVYDRLMATGKLERRIARLYRHLDRRSQNEASHQRFGDWARQQAGVALERFSEALPGDPADVSQLHQFRIAGKQLRYLMELLAPAFPARFRKRLYREVVSLQDRLGSVNDHAVAIRHFDNWLTSLDNPLMIELLPSLRRKEQAALEREVSEFAAAWSLPRVEAFQSEFRTVIEAG